MELLLGDESLELFVDFTWFIAGGFGAALFFILLGGVEDLESEDPDWPWLFCSWAFGLHRGKREIIFNWSGVTLDPVYYLFFKFWFHKIFVIIQKKIFNNINNSI